MICLTVINKKQKPSPMLGASTTILKLYYIFKTIEETGKYKVPRITKDLELSEVRSLLDEYSKSTSFWAFVCRKDALFCFFLFCLLIFVTFRGGKWFKTSSSYVVFASLYALLAHIVEIILKACSSSYLGKAVSARLNNEMSLIYTSIVLVFLVLAIGSQIKMVLLVVLLYCTIFPILKGNLFNFNGTVLTLSTVSLLLCCYLLQRFISTVITQIIMPVVFSYMGSLALLALMHATTGKIPNILKLESAANSLNPSSYKDIKFLTISWVVLYSAGLAIQLTESYRKYKSSKKQEKSTKN